MTQKDLTQLLNGTAPERWTKRDNHSDHSKSMREDAVANWESNKHTISSDEQMLVVLLRTQESGLFVACRALTRQSGYSQPPPLALFSPGLKIAEIVTVLISWHVSWRERGS